ncbi:MAG: hypothetical protein AAB432_03175 [Patescibacteria group bacterium]
MRIHSISKIKSLKHYRKIGYSIHELMIKFNMPKTTIWHHIHNLELSEKQKEILRRKQGGSKIRTAKQWKIANILSKELVRSIKIKEIAPVILTLLYWAEGNKKGFAFTNTDPNMIKIFLKILRECFGVKNIDVKAIIRINNFQNSSESINYWHAITRIPTKNIGTNLNPIQNKGKSKYGVLRITVRKSGRLFKLINSINNELTLKTLSSILKTTSPLVAQMD